jgi:putative transposase
MKGMVHDLCYHIVLSTEGRRPLISPGLKIGLYGLFAEVVERRGGRLSGIGGIPNHVHLLVRLPPSEPIGDLVCSLKSESLRWASGRKEDRLRWEEGYGVFSVSKAQTPTVLDLLEQQDQRHLRRSYAHELLSLINGHDSGNVSTDKGMTARSVSP